MPKADDDNDNSNRVRAPNEDTQLTADQELAGVTPVNLNEDPDLNFL